MTGYLGPPVQGDESRENQINRISHAFYNMPPEVVVDLFTNHRRETHRDVTALGTHFWLESTFKKKVLGINFEIFALGQLTLLRTLASLLIGETRSQSIIATLQQADWFKAAFAPLFEDIANDMFHMYFCRNNQI